MITPDSVASTTVSAATDEPVLVAYRAFWSMYVELVGSPPPFDAAATKARLGVLTTGAEQQQLFGFLQTNAATGVVINGDVDLAPIVESNDGTTAVVRDCLDDRLIVFRLADGSRVDQDVPGRTVYMVQLRMLDGAWKVEKVATKAESCGA